MTLKLNQNAERREERNTTDLATKTSVVTTLRRDEFIGLAHRGPKMNFLLRPSGAGGADRKVQKRPGPLNQEGRMELPADVGPFQPGAHHLCPRTSRTRGVLRVCATVGWC